MSYKTQYHPSSGEYWKKAWECKDTDWHIDQIDSWLDRNLDILTAGREEIRIFFPLSGKAKDMKWLADKGHHVVGAEVSPLACQQFFSENDIPHTVIPFPGCNGSLYKSNDGKIEVYCCNIFDFNKDTAGVFDAIWDKGGIVAIDPTQVAKYLKLIESLMAPGCQYVVQQITHIIPERSGPPYYTSLEQLQTIFGSQFNFEVLAYFPSPYFQKVFNSASVSLEVIKTTKK